MKKLLLCLFFVSTIGCTTLPNGTRVPDTGLIRDLTTVSAAVIVSEAQAQGLNTQEVLKYVQIARTLVKETPKGQVVDLNSINTYLSTQVPVQYQIVGRLVVRLIDNRVSPILNSEIEQSEKAKQVVNVIDAVLSGVEDGIRVSTIQ